MSTDFVSAIVLLVLVTDPSGNVPLAVAALRDVASRD